MTDTASDTSSVDDIAWDLDTLIAGTDIDALMDRSDELTAQLAELAAAGTPVEDAAPPDAPAIPYPAVTPDMPRMGGKDCPPNSPWFGGWAVCEVHGTLKLLPVQKFGIAPKLGCVRCGFMAWL